MQHRSCRAATRRQVDLLDLPDALAAVVAVLLQDAWTSRLKSGRERLAERKRGAVKLGVGASTQMLSAGQDLFHPHLQDHVGMCTHPATARCNIAEQCIEHGPALALIQRVNPDQHTVDRQKLRAHFIGKCFIEHRRLGTNT